MMNSLKPFSHFCFFRIVFFYLLFSQHLFAQEISLQSYMDQVIKNSEDIQAIELEIEALRLEIEARDLELTPVFGVELDRFWDNRPSASSDPQTSGRSVGITLTKPLSTGTDLNLLSGEISRFKTRDDGTENTMAWEVGLTQSLWKNAFGRQTRRRRRRDEYELRVRYLTLMLDRQKVIADFESLFWQIAYLQQQVRIRKENLERSRLILSWIQDRYKRSAAEHVDLLQAEALVTSRELQLIVAEDELKTLQARLGGLMPVSSDIIPLETDLEKNRPLTDLVITGDYGQTVITSIEALRSQSQIKVLDTDAQFEKDKLRPDLEVGYFYGRQGVDAVLSKASHAAVSRGRDYHALSMIFSTPLDIPLILKSNRSYTLKAQAQSIRDIRFRRQSGILWLDLMRTVEEQKRRVETARNVSKLQKEKSEEERTRYEKGRTTAFQAITFEQEAAESELLVAQLLAHLRNTEAQAHFFMKPLENHQ